MVPGIDYPRYMYSGPQIPKQGDFDSICKLLPQRSRNSHKAIPTLRRRHRRVKKTSESGHCPKTLVVLGCACWWLSLVWLGAGAFGGCLFFSLACGFLVVSFSFFEGADPRTGVKGLASRKECQLVSRRTCSVLYILLRWSCHSMSSCDGVKSDYCLSRFRSSRRGHEYSHEGSSQPSDTGHQPENWFGLCRDLRHEEVSSIFFRAGEGGPERRVGSLTVLGFRFALPERLRLQRGEGRIVRDIATSG